MELSIAVSLEYTRPQPLDFRRGAEIEERTRRDGQDVAVESDLPPVGGRHDPDRAIAGALSGKCREVTVVAECGDRAAECRVDVAIGVLC